MRYTLLLILFLYFSLIVVAETAVGVDAEVVNFDVKPANPVKGDVVTIAGQAQPDENITIKVSFGNVVPVEDGIYTFFLPKMHIPETVNRFTLRVEGCDDVKVSVKDYAERYPHWITRSLESNNGVAEVSGVDIPAMIYDVLVHGRSSQTSAKITITVEGYEKADENGYFSHSYDTSSVPLGEFSVQVQNKTETAYLRLPTLPTAPVRIQERDSRFRCNSSAVGHSCIRCAPRYISTKKEEVITVLAQ
jgi:hypothetical protein